MPLSHFHPERYAQLLDAKTTRARAGFAPFTDQEPRVVPSEPTHFRLRAEFRMWRSNHTIDFVMFRPGQPREPITITDFPIAARAISERMPALKAALDRDEVLRNRLFQSEFLTTTTGDTLLTLIYHRPLDAEWETRARALQTALGVKLVGRSRRQKLTLGEDTVTEQLEILGRTYRYRQAEGVFTQPNGGVNRAMITWLLEHTPTTDSDLLELYCGVGNFTLPLASRFRRVLATEIAKQAVACAQHNIEDNGIANIDLVRMSSEEFSQAMAGVRPFRRLAHIDLQHRALDTLLVDPPRAGLDPGTLALARRFPRIMYISCNPTTLQENLARLADTHRVDELALFDQFPYTEHLECGVILQRR